MLRGTCVLIPPPSTTTCRSKSGCDCTKGNVDGARDAFAQTNMPENSLNERTENAGGLGTESRHYEAMRWLWTNGCPLNESACSSAAANGDLQLLQWLRLSGCLWDEWACRLAALNGHMAVLRWLRGNGCQWDEWACCYAAENGHIAVQWCSS